MPRGRTVALLAILVVLGFRSPVQAGPITLSTTANASISPGFFDQDSVNSALSATTDLQLSSMAYGSFSPDNLNSTLDVYAYAFVRTVSGGLSVGVETLSDSDTTIGAGGPYSATTNTGIGSAGLNVNDALTIIGGPTSGSLLLTFAVSGSLSTETNGQTTFANTATASGTFFVNTNTNPDNVLHLNAHSQNGPGGDTGPMLLEFPETWTVVIPYSGSFANLLIHLDSSAITGNACFGSGVTCTQTASGALGHTFTLGLIQVLDGSGQIIPDAYATGESGIRYNNVPQAATAPEPSMVALLLFGLSTVAVRRRRGTNTRKITTMD